MHAGERTRIQELKPSSVEARRFVCSSFQLNEADTPSASSIQLNTAPFSSTSAPLAQLKLNNPEAAETRHAYGRVPYKHVDSLWTSKHVHGSLFEHMHGMCIPHTWAAYVANSSNDVSTAVSIKEADPEVLPQGPVTRSKARKFREVISLNCVKLSDSFNDIPALDNVVYNVLHTDERAYISPRSVTYEEGSSDDPEERPSSLQTQAIIRELKKSFREKLEPIHDRLERLEGSQNNATEEDHAENGSDQTPNQRQNPRQGRVQQVDDNLTNIKIAIPSFQGQTDPDAIMLTAILTSRRYKEARFTGCLVSFGSGDQSDGRNEQNPPDLQLQALERMMRRIVSDAIEPLASRMDRIDGGSQFVHDEVQGEIEVDQSPRQRTPRQGRMQQVDDNISNIKVAIPSFQGRSDPYAYYNSDIETI
ncbi:hypothetical protein GQ457_03G017560 [Hibiscus cannabinus]